MRKVKGKYDWSNKRKGVTLVELLVAFTLIVIIFAAIVPQFKVIRDSWAVAEAGAAIIQNGRVLSEHITRNISAAKRIVSVSPDSQTSGFITFQDNNDVTKRYMLSGGYVAYGVVGSEEQLAGPVSRFQISCYKIYPTVGKTTDANEIRLVEVETDFTNSDALGTDKTFKSQAFIQTNATDQVWFNQDIGNVAAEGTADSNECVWTIDASGRDIWNRSDEFHYVYQYFSGDGRIIARVVSVENTNSWAKAGVMFRETLNANSRHAMMVVTPGNGTAFQRRRNTGGNSSHTAGSSVTAPYWVKLVREGNLFSGYDSPDGATWTYVGSATVNMASNIFVGLAVTSHNDGTLCTAVIDNVIISGIAYEGFEEAKVSSEDTSITIPRPAATEENDLLIAAVATDGDTEFSLSPSGGEGWNEIDIGSYLGQTTLGAWWKLADASESLNHTFSWSSGNLQQAYGWIMRFTGHDTTNPINVSMPGGQDSISPTSPAVTTTSDNCLILRLGAFDNNDIITDDPNLLPDHSTITADTSVAQVTYMNFSEEKVNSNRNRIYIDKPSGTSNGDLLIAAVVTDDDSLPFSPPGGWILIKQDERHNDVTLGVWYKIAGSSEPTNYRFDWSGSDRAYGWIMRFTGHDSTGPIDVSAIDDGSSSSPDCPTITTTVNNAMIVCIGGFDDDDIWWWWPDFSGLEDNGYETITMDRNGSSGRCSGGAGYKCQETAGSSDFADFLLRNYEGYITVTLAIAPYPTATGAGTVSGGAGYSRLSNSGDTGTSNFSLTAANESRMLTIGIAPANTTDDCYDDLIRP